jgi:ABC-type multidrug transport system ATPase subunit
MPILALEAENLVKAYQGSGRPAADGISFAVAPGMVFAAHSRRHR